MARDGKPILERAYGVANRATGARNRIDTKFNLASVGKSFTAVAIAQLVQAGKLSFADKIGRYVPELRHKVGSRITIAELLDHTSGLGDYFASPLYPTLQPDLTSLAAYLPMIVAETPVGRPGAVFRYSNSGYILLGLLIEKVSGMPYPAYLRQRLFEPLGLTHTSYCGGSALVPRRVRGYVAEEGTFANAPPVDMSQGYAAGGICSTVGDLLRWQQALHLERFNGAELHRAMVTTAPGRSYGLGIGVGAHGSHRVLFHYGGVFGFDAAIVTYPDDGVAIAVLANCDDAASDVETRVARALLGIGEEPAQQLPAEMRARIVGTYRTARGFTMRIAARDDALFLEADGARPVRITYVGGDAFRQERSLDLLHVDGERLAITHYGAVRFEAARAGPDH